MGYLSLSTAKAKDFVTIVNDYYKSIDNDSDNSLNDDDQDYNTPKNNHSNRDADFGIE